MNYMLLIIGNQDAEPLPEGGQSLMEQFMAYHQSVIDAGIMVDSNVLDSFETATSVQVTQGGERIVTDGPFAETREYLGGYYILDLPDLDAAIDWAARCPGARAGRVEIRPVQADPRIVTSDRPLDSVEAVFREEQGRLLATLVRQFGDLDLAEDVASDAMEAALNRWPVDGVPTTPLAWLITTARRKAVDRLRRNKAFATRLAILHIEAEQLVPAPSDPETNDIPDERLRLFFTCCHPALSLEAQIALTLRYLGGLSTTEVARAFLVSEATMQQRIVRAKRKIRELGSRFECPRARSWPNVFPRCCTSLYLIFTEGYAASAGAELVRVDLSEEAIRLARILHRLLPGEAEVSGLLALFLLVDARRAHALMPRASWFLSRTKTERTGTPNGSPKGRDLVVVALQTRSPGPYALQAAIAAVHAEARHVETTDWVQIVALYDVLAT